MSKVYIVNRGGHDFTPAKRFGEFIYMTEGTINPFAITSMYRTFANYIEVSTPEDYLLPTGLPIMNIIASSCFAYKHGFLNLLMFKNGEYIARKIKLDELLTIDDKCR